MLYLMIICCFITFASGFILGCHITAEMWRNNASSPDYLESRKELFKVRKII